MFHKLKTSLFSLQSVSETWTPLPSQSVVALQQKTVIFTAFQAEEILETKYGW